MNYIKVLDKHGKFNKWMIEYETEAYYEIFRNGYVTFVGKDRCSIFDGELISYQPVILHDDEEDVGSQSTGSEQCYICGREVYSLSRLVVLENTDNYACKKCAKLIKTRVKAAKNL